MSEIGPVQLLSIGFDAGADFQGRIIDELARLESERTVRVLDVLFIARDPDSDETVTLEHPNAADFGGIVGELSAWSSSPAPPRRLSRAAAAASIPSASRRTTSSRWPPDSGPARPRGCS